MQMGTSTYQYSGLLSNAVGDKRYELSNHLGNVLQVVSDSKLPIPAFTPTITDRVGISVDGNGVITRTAAGAGWNAAGGASVEKVYSGGYVEWTLGGTNLTDNYPVIVGLSYVNSGLHHNTINYAWYMHSTVTARVNELGTLILNAGAYILGTVFKIQRDGGNIKYYMNGALKRTVADVNPDEPMIVDFTLNNYGDKIYSLKIVNQSYTADVKSYSDYYPYGMQMPGRNGSEGEYRYGYQGSERDDEAKGAGNSYTTHFRQLDPRLGRWLSIDPKATAWESPYVSMGNTPTFHNDPLGDTLIGMSRRSAERTMEIIKGTFNGKKFDALNKLFTLKDDGRTFNNISQKSFDEATKGLSDDEKALAKGYFLAINDNKRHVTSILYPGEKISNHTAKALTSKNNPLTANSTASELDKIVGGGVNYVTEKGDVTVIIMGSSVPITDSQPYEGEDYYEGKRTSSTGELLAHELLGHGLTRTNNNTAYNQWKNAVLMSNLYMRTHGDPSIYRDGTQHGLVNDKGQPIQPTALTPSQSKEIPSYLK